MTRGTVISGAIAFTAAVSLPLLLANGPWKRCCVTSPKANGVCCYAPATDWHWTP